VRVQVYVVHVQHVQLYVVFVQTCIKVVVHSYVNVLYCTCYTNRRAATHCRLATAVDIVVTHVEHLHSI